MSLAALNTAATIMVDVAEFILRNAEETMPLCCRHICRVAYDHLGHNKSHPFSLEQTRRLASIIAKEGIFNSKLDTGQW
jgi:hypothetical protein